MLDVIVDDVIGGTPLEAVKEAVEVAEVAEAAGTGFFIGSTRRLTLGLTAAELTVVAVDNDAPPPAAAFAFAIVIFAPGVKAILPPAVVAMVILPAKAGAEGNFFARPVAAETVAMAPDEELVVMVVASSNEETEVVTFAGVTTEAPAAEVAVLSFAASERQIF